jgi:SAM-dependent methyltransferase
MSETPKKNNEDGRDVLREFFKQWPAFYYFIATVFGPVWFTGLSPRAFLTEYARDGKKVNLGSGPRTIAPDVLNIDGTKYDSVDIVADITALPLEADSVGMIICDNVLEHVPDADRAMREMYRILKPGGVAYLSTPFLYPFHSSPSDYHRWTAQGLAHLCRDFKMEKIGVRAGLMSGVSVLACYGFARLFSCGSERAHWFLVNVALFICFPIKLFDIVLNVFPFGLNTASVFYCVIKKPSL